MITVTRRTIRQSAFHHGIEMRAAGLDISLRLTDALKKLIGASAPIIESEVKRAWRAGIREGYAFQGTIKSRR